MPVGLNITAPRILNGLSLRKFISGIIPPLPENAVQNPEVSFIVPNAQLIMASLVINILSLALPILTLQVYDRLLVSHNTGTLQVLTVGVVVVMALSTFLHLCRSYVTTWAGATYEHALSCNAIRHVLAADLVSLHRDGIGTHLQRMENIGKLREFMSGSALITLIELPFIFVFLALIAWLAGWLVLVPITLLGIFITLSVFIGKQLKVVLKRREHADRQRLDFTIEALGGIHSLKSLALESFFQRRYETVQKRTSYANIDLGRLNAEAAMMGTMFSQIMLVTVIAFGAPMALNNSITMGTLIACVLISARITQPVQRSLGLWTRYQDFSLAHKEVTKTFSLPVLDRIDPSKLEDNQGQVRIENMSFFYSANDDVLLHDINLDLNFGDAISISGPHGHGKTTLLKLMAGLYNPCSGDVLIDGAPATRYPARELVRHVGFLPMDGMIFRGTIWENLSAFGEYEAPLVHEMSELLGIEESIKHLPAGFDTKLEGRQSDPLPPGLCQRLAIARALMPKPRVILFDNADRSLDRSGYNTVYRLLARLKNKATMVIVSDDHNISRLADKEYVLASGRLIHKQNTNDDIHNIMPYQELRL